MSLSPTERLARAERDRIRAEAQQEATRSFNAMVAATGVSLAEVARSCGRASSAIDRWASMASPQVPTDADIQRMPGHCRLWYLERDARELGLGVADLPPIATDVVNDLRLAAEAQREYADAIATLIDALADGHIVRAEGAELVRKCNAAIAVTLAIRLRAEQAESEGSVRMRFR